MDASGLLRLVPWDEVGDLVDDLVARGIDDDAVVAEVGALLDGLLPFQIIAAPFGAPVAAVIELVDGWAFRSAIQVAIAIARNTEGRPARKAARVARRAARKADRTS